MRAAAAGLVLAAVVLVLWHHFRPVPERPAGEVPRASLAPWRPYLPIEPGLRLVYSTQVRRRLEIEPHDAEFEKKIAPLDETTVRFSCLRVERGGLDGCTLVELKERETAEAALAETHVMRTLVLSRERTGVTAQLAGDTDPLSLPDGQELARGEAVALSYAPGRRTVSCWPLLDDAVRPDAQELTLKMQQREKLPVPGAGPVDTLRIGASWSFDTQARDASRLPLISDRQREERSRAISLTLRLECSGTVWLAEGLGAVREAREYVAFEVVPTREMDYMKAKDMPDGGVFERRWTCRHELRRDLVRVVRVH